MKYQGACPVIFYIAERFKKLVLGGACWINGGSLLRRLYLRYQYLCDSDDIDDEMKAEFLSDHSSGRLRK